MTMFRPSITDSRKQNRAHWRTAMLLAAAASLAMMLTARAEDSPGIDRSSVAGPVVKIAKHGKAHRAHRITDANGNGLGVVRSTKTGATASVSPKYRAAFQGYIDDVEAAGASVRFMGGIRRGHCSIPESKHPCGMALDVCQYARGVVDKRCKLPGRSELARIAARHGLLEGGVWCHSDLGHVEVRTARQALGCRRNLYADVSNWKRHRAEATP